MADKETNTFCPKNKTEWRQWLADNHRTEPSVWLIYYTKKSNISSLSWSQAVDEALCFGWIDSTKKKIDESSYMQFFSKRKPKSNWSKINKEKVANLISQGLMTEAGFACIEVAKENGSWTILDETEATLIPSDLEAAFAKHPGAKDYFLAWSKSTRKIILSWIVLAKKEETRQTRIIEVATRAALNLKPKHLK